MWAPFTFSAHSQHSWREQVSCCSSVGAVHPALGGSQGPRLLRCVSALCLCVASPGRRRWLLNRSAVKSRCMRAIVSGSSQDDLTTQPPADPGAIWVPDARAGKAMGEPPQGAGSLMMTAVPRLLRTPLSAQGGRLRADSTSLFQGPLHSL